MILSQVLLLISTTDWLLLNFFSSFPKRKKKLSITCEKYFSIISVYVFYCFYQNLTLNCFLKMVIYHWLI